MSLRQTLVQPFGLLLEPDSGSAHVRDVDVEHLRQLFRRHHLLVLRGFNTFTTSEDFGDYCAAWGEISLWPFGRVLELREQDAPEDHIFDCSYVPLHWDGMYRPQVPEIQIFHCPQAPLPGHGGRTTFSNTLLALQQATDEQKALWDRVTVTYRRKMEFYDSRTVSPILTRHPFRDYPVIRYNEVHSIDQGRLVNPVAHEYSGLASEDVESFQRGLRGRLYSPDCFYAHEWRDGDLVIADNFTLLHGREAFTSKSPRHIQRVQVLSNPPFENPGLESYT